MYPFRPQPHSALTPGRKRAGSSEDLDAIEVPERFMTACHGKKSKVGMCLCVHIETCMCVSNIDMESMVGVLGGWVGGCD